jgi:hypothetical protein
MNNKLVTITVKKETLDFIKDLVNEIEKQDNRCTAQPYFYVVKTTKEMVAPEGFGDKNVRVDWSHGDPQQFETKEEFAIFYKQYGNEDLSNEIALLKDDLKELEEEYDEEFAFGHVWNIKSLRIEKNEIVDKIKQLEDKLDVETDNAWDKLDRYGLHVTTDEHNVFFTERGYNQHMELNGHNYRHGTEKAYSYVKHAFRNPEIENIFKALKDISKAELEQN